MQRAKRNKVSDITFEQNLVTAAGNGDLKTILALLENGTPVDAQEHNRMLFYASKNYLTPLQMACANGHTVCAEVLISQGADVNAKDRFDVTAMHIAAEKGHCACLKALLNASTECSHPTKYSKMGCYTAVPYRGGTTPLHLAAANNQIDCVVELMQYGADYNAIDELGRTSLYIAAESGFEDCVLAHLRNAVGRDILSLPSFDTRDTPLHFAVSKGMVGCIRALLDVGADVNHINYAGATPVHLAVTPRKEVESVGVSILQMLILDGYNSNVNCGDSKDFSPLHYCCFVSPSFIERRTEMARLLLSYGADFNIWSGRGFSLLEWELRYPSEDCGVLKYMVRSMGKLPPLSKLRAVPTSTTTFGGTQLLYEPSEPCYREVCELRHEDFFARADEPYPFPKPHLVQYEKNVWYRSMSCNPRTLKHWCRYAVRNALGPLNMKYIKNLPVPSSTQTFLFLDEGD